MRTTLGKRLSETNPVVIIEPPLSVLRTRRLSCFESRISPIGRLKTGWRYYPLHFPERIPGLSSSVRALNRIWLQRELDQLLPEGAPRIICYDSPQQHHLVHKLGEQLSIYLVVDDRTRTLRGEPIPGELEAEKLLLGKVDTVICISEFLSDVLKTRIPRRHKPSVYVLPNGYDENLFDPSRSWEEPLLLAKVSKPRILVAGHVSERIDWEGINAAVHARPDWTWLFVGLADQSMREKIDVLGGPGIPCHNSGSPKLVWRAPIPIEQMPALISHCDVCAVPYRLNSFTLASSPLKGIEYLAMGSPVLSTRIPALKQYDSVIQWVEQGNGESYVRGLDNLIREQRNPSVAEARRSAVSRDTNKERTREFLRIINKETFHRPNFQPTVPV